MTPFFFCCVTGRGLDFAGTVFEVAVFTEPFGEAAAGLVFWGCVAFDAALAEVELLLGCAAGIAAASLPGDFSVCGFGTAASLLTVVGFGRGGVHPIAFSGISLRDCNRS